MKKLWLLIALVVVSLAAPALAQEKRTITVATDATWPPFEFVDENKALVGFSVEYMQAAAAEGGYEIKIINAAWDGIFAGLVNKQYDAICSSVTITDDRKKTMDFSDPYFTVSQAVLVPQSSSVKALEDLKGKTAGSQIGTTGTFAIDKIGGVTSKTYDEVGLAVEDLYDGRLDA
ncbi:MAG: transporter substrate-binding domain-containing protein, partial [Candidatus Adiutrix sp.]|nr:transporter substrate-binding domain-containing protein [Candidatus Adiutrix sp.]